MAENMPSLFDFDDEDFFPIPEKKEEHHATPQDESKKEPIAKEEEESQPAEPIPDKETQTPASIQHTEEDSKNKYEARESIEEKPATLAHQNTKQPSQAEEKTQKAFIKPSLELPKPLNQGKEPTNQDREVQDTYDRQINALNPPAAKAPAAFTFEPRKEQKKPAINAEETTVSPEAEKETTVPDSHNNVLPDNTEPIAEDSEVEKDLPEWELNKKYYTIGEVAKLFEVNVSHIRFWTTEFRIKTRTTRKGDRLYTPKQIGELRLIHHLVKVKKHTLKGAKEVLQQGSTQLEKKLDLKDELQKLYQLLSEVRENL